MASYGSTDVDKYEETWSNDPERVLLDKEGDNTGSDDIRIILLGKTGGGKSATGNSIVGHKVFKDSTLAESETKKGKYARIKYMGKVSLVVDTPGLFDTKMSEDELKLEIIKCFTLIAPGPHVILYVIRIGRFTEESIKAEQKFLEMFRDEVYKYTVIVLTGKDDNDHHEISDNEYLSKIPRAFEEFIEKCNKRVIFVNNRVSPIAFKPQWGKIYDMIISMTKSNETFYRNKLLDALEKELTLKIKELRKTNESIPESQDRESLRQSIENEGWFLKYLMSKEALIGAAVGGFLTFITGFGPAWVTAAAATGAAATGAVSRAVAGGGFKRCSIS